MKKEKKEILIPVNDSFITGDLTIVERAHGLIIFAHGSGSSRFSSRNQFVAGELNNAHFSTFLFDLLTPEEDTIDQYTQEFRFNIQLLTDRLILVTEWAQKNEETHKYSIGYFGSSTGAAAALIAAAELKTAIGAVVSRGGRPDLAQGYLSLVQAPTLLIFGEQDYEVIELNQDAFEKLPCKKKVEIIPGATHLFEEPGTLEEVTRVAMNWFKEHLN